MNFRRASSPALGLLAAATAACNPPVDSDEIETAAIVARIEVRTTSESASTVDATLETVELLDEDVENTVRVVLSPEDTLYAKAGDAREEMKAVPEEKGVYRVELGVGAAGAEFVVDLYRAFDVPAPSSRGELPAPFSLVDLGGRTAKRGTEELAIEWDAIGAGEDMLVELRGDCVEPFSASAPDTGRFAIPAGALEAADEDEPATCAVTVEVSRSRSGAVDEALSAESTFRLRQVRTTTFTSEP